MARRLWTADEFGRLSPDEQDAIFESSIVTDLSKVPEPFLAQIRSRLEQRLVGRDTPPPQ